MPPSLSSDALFEYAFPAVPTRVERSSLPSSAPRSTSLARSQLPVLARDSDVPVASRATNTTLSPVLTFSDDRSFD